MNNDIHILYLEGGNYAHLGFPAFLKNLGFQVTTVSSEDTLFDYFHESQVNAFNIFDEEKYQCIIFDVFSSSQDSFSAVKRLKDTYKTLPPLIALATPEQSLLRNNFKNIGFDNVIEFPTPEKNFLTQLKVWLDIESSENQTESHPKFIEEKVENFPVISLKTYSTILKQAGKNDFSLLPLYSDFLSELEIHMKHFIEAFENQDRNKFDMTICAIRGLSVTMGAIQVYQMANRIESYSSKGQTEQVGELLPYLIEKFLILQEFILQWKVNQGVIAA